MNFRVHRVRFFEYQPKAIQCLTFNPSSDRLALSRSDGSIEIWSVAGAWFQEKVILVPESDSTEDLTWCGQRLFAASLNSQIIEYNLHLLQKERQEPSNAGAVWCIESSPLKTEIAAGTEDGCVVIFDITNDQLIYDRAFDKQEGRILTLSWHNSGDFIATGGIDNIRVWSVKAGHAIVRMTVPRQNRNKETIVWSVKLLDDMTVISGDSQGKTCFWNGKQGTLTKSYKAHKADVLVVCVNETKDTVVSAGIDPLVIQFRLTDTQNGTTEWVPSRSHNFHTHDIRAVAFIHNTVVSGGVDTSLIACRIRKNLAQESTKYLAIPHSPLVSIASTAHILLFNYHLYLELWQLGDTNQTSEKDGEILPLNSQPMKLLQLKARSECCISCCALSHDAQHLAYSDQSTIRLYKVNIDKLYDPPVVSLSKIKFLEACPPSRKLAFTHSTDFLISLGINGDISLIKLEDDIAETIDTVTHSKNAGETSFTHLLAVSPNDQYIATADIQSNVHIYHINKSSLSFQGTLPCYSHSPTAMTFSPQSDKLLVAYSDRMILEYRVKKLVFTKWSKNNIDNFSHAWLSLAGTISHVTYSTRDVIVVQDAERFCVIDQREAFPDPEVKDCIYKHSSDVENAFHICDEYKYLLMVEPLIDDWLVIVERPPIAISQSLPPALQQKKYGT